MSLLQKGKNVLELALTVEIWPQFRSVLVVVETLPLCLSLEQTIMKLLAAMEIMVMDYAHVGVSPVQQITDIVIWLLLMVIGCISLPVQVDSILKN